MRLALVSAPGTPMATNLSFWPLRALGTSKIGFLVEKWLTLMGRIFADVENTIYWLFVKLFLGVQPWVHLEVSGFRSQLSGLMCQVSETGAVASQIFDFSVQERLGYIWTGLKCKKNEIGTSLSFWDANGNKFVILASSSPRDLENRIPCWKMINFDGANVS